MSAVQPAAFATSLSLPPVTARTMSEVVGAQFAAPVTAAAVAAAPAGSVIMALGATATPFMASGRHCLIIDPDPLALLATSVQLHGPTALDIGRVLTRLLDAPYRGRPWGHTLQGLYVTSCPACGRPTTAHAYHWQGSPPAIISRTLHCELCNFSGETPAEAEDRSRAAEAEPGRTLYWETMERVVAATDSLRGRAEQATGFHTPRSLWALWQTLRILRDLDLPQDQRRALQWVLAEALWHASSLADQPELLWQTTVRRPRRFVERNVWEVLHECLAYVQSLSGWVQTFAGIQPDVNLVQRWPADYLPRLPRESIALALIQTPPALPLYWLLRYVWSGWLFGPQAAAAMADLLALRPGEWELLQRRIGDTSSMVRERLAPGGEIAVQWRWRGEADPSAALLAVLPAEIDVSVAAVGGDEWMAAALTTSRTLKVASAKVPASESSPAAAALVPDAALLQSLLSQRGEPEVAARLRPALLSVWHRSGDMPASDDCEDVLQAWLDPQAPPAGIQVWGSSGTMWEPGETPWWWMDEPPHPWLPATDLSEHVALDLLQQALTYSIDELGWQMTLRLPPACAPDRDWVEALAASYCDMKEGGLTLRAQDQPGRRLAELAELAAELVTAGQRMAFEPTSWSEESRWTVEWRQAGQRRASFLLTATTDLTARLWQSRAPIPGLLRFLIVPGGRAGLVQWRIDHQPLWAAASLAGGWTFAKFRHLRDMLTEIDEEPYRWLAHLSLDPITAIHAEQMRLL